MTAEGMGLLCLTTTAFRLLLSFLADLACLPYWLLLSEERENRLFTLSPSRHLALGYRSEPCVQSLLPPPGEFQTAFIVVEGAGLATRF